MMATSLVQLTKQIEKLQREADALKAKEAKGVIARIREAIDHYQLTAGDLGFGRVVAKKGRPPAKAAAKKAGKVRKAGKRASAKKTAGVIKYRGDEAGNTWTGHGKRPGWFIAALEAGRTREELEVKGS